MYFSFTNFDRREYNNKSIQPLKAVKCDTSPRFSTTENG